MTRTVKQMFGILLVLLMFPISILAESGKIVSNGGKVNVRKLPEDKARIVMTVKKGTTIRFCDFYVTFHAFMES